MLFSIPIVISNLGLTLEVFLDQGNYMKNRLSKKAGAKIVIHDPNTTPLPNEHGLELRPNSASSIAVQKNDIKRKAGAVEPNAQECAFAHPLFEPQLSKLQILRTHFLGTH